MIRSAHLLVVLGAIVLLGCSGVSMIERENLTRPEAREEFVVNNPGGSYNEFIRNGEIVKGMDIYEVMASWGLPNVYLVSNSEPLEHWIYYVQNEDSRSILIYTLTFDDDCLHEWDIDLKRFTDTRVVFDSSTSMETIRRSMINPSRSKK